ncbi:hypothetical protein Leryth_014041 [Lithospermum erythrorhizon]|nr:hypothetical protein Leryth_014041 [Lithospermum erythrorhizon]
MEKTRALEDIQSSTPQTAIRCAKVAILLSSLKHSLTSSNNCLIPSEEEDEKAKMVKLELLREKEKNNKLKVNAVMDLFLQILMMLLLWTLWLLIAAEFCY